MSFESGSPTCAVGGVLRSATTVGSIISLLFCCTSTVGGVICCLAALGGVPAEAFILLASPPPPPLGPFLPIFIGMYEDNSIGVTLVGGRSLAGTAICSSHSSSAM